MPAERRSSSSTAVAIGTGTCTTALLELAGCKPFVLEMPWSCSVGSFRTAHSTVVSGVQDAAVMALLALAEGLVGTALAIVDNYLRMMATRNLNLSV